ncbi:MAG: cell division protein FtsA [Lentisphaerae bacterium]|jgi:cell division protein FtsA|nr:cell division protein FtsA [Lentisphaerota bacterium]
MALPPIAALEIGTTQTVALVGEIDDMRRVTITGRGVYKTSGVRKGQVFDVDLAKAGVAKAVQQASEESNVDVGSLLLAVSGGHIEAKVNRGSVPVRGRDRIVSREDVEEVTELAQSLVLPSDRDIMHTVNQSFTLDDQTGILKPEGLSGAQLSLDMLVIHTQRNRIDNLRKVVQSVEMDVEDVVFSGLCVALSSLTSEQKRNGVAVIDLGGGTTSFLAYADNVIACAGSFGVGGDHITNDLTVAFNLPTGRAEDLKRRQGHAIVSSSTGLKRLIIPEELGMQERSISLKAFHTVINARQAETLRLVRSALHEAGILTRLNAGIIFTGGGAALPGLTELGRSIFGLPCLIGEPCNVGGLANVEAPAAYATAAGLVLYGFKTYQETGIMRPVKEFLQGIFRR